MKRSTRATIKDVAAAAGVTSTTVSDAMSGKGRLSAETRARVQEVANQLGYRPNALARGLRGNGLGLLGLVISPAPTATLSTAWYWSTIANKATETAFAGGFALVLLPHNAAVLSTMPIPLDGAIVVDPIAKDPVLKSLRDSGIYLVTVGRDVQNVQEPWVDDDNVKGVRQLLARCIRPESRIAMLTIDPLKSYSNDVHVGAEQWAAESKSTLISTPCSGIDNKSIDSALDMALSHKISAILAQSDKLAIAALSRLQARGIKVPGDMVLLSATDSPELAHTKPPITAMHQHPERLGELAASALIESIKGAKPPGQQLVTLDIMIRRSAPALRG